MACLARELRVQTVWTEAFEKTQAPIMPLCRSGLQNQLFGYDDIYVLSSDDAPVYAFAPTTMFSAGTRRSARR